MGKEEGRETGRKEERGRKDEKERKEKERKREKEMKKALSSAFFLILLLYTYIPFREILYCPFSLKFNIF